MRAVLLLAAWLKLAAAASPAKKIFCLVGSNSMEIRYIEPNLCTHIVYYYAPMKGGDVEVFRASTDIPDNWGDDGYGQVNALRRRNPSLKTLIRVHGNITEFMKCPQMASNSTCPEKVADNIVKFTKRWSFDGVDLSWWWVPPENPARAQQDIIELLKSLRMRCNAAGLILSLSVYCNEVFASRHFNIPEVIELLDFIHAQCYRFTDLAAGRTGMGAPLQARFYDNAPAKTGSIEASVMYWLSRGTPRDKLVIGITPAGASYTLATPNYNTVGAPTRGPGTAGVISRKLGYLGYNEICDMQKSGDWTVVFDEEYHAPYTFKGDQWISYDNVRSISEKAELFARLNLTGITFANMQCDDYSGICGEKWPLLKAVNAVFRNNDPVPQEPPSVTRTPQCTRCGYMRDPYSCALIMCTPNTTHGYEQHYFECRPGTCNNPLIGQIRAERVDPNLFVCGN